MVNCVVKNCKNRSRKGLTLFRVPRSDREVRNLWIEFVRRNRPGWEPTSSSRICEAHFTPDCIQKSSKEQRRYLTPTAFPTLLDIILNVKVFKKRSRNKTTLKSRKITTQNTANNILEVAEENKESEDKVQKTNSIETDDAETLILEKPFNERPDCKDCFVESSNCRLPDKRSRRQIFKKTIDSENGANVLRTSFSKVTKSLAHLCRVCGKYIKKKAIGVFSNQGKAMALEGMICRFLPIVVSKIEIDMPQKVCMQCVAHLKRCQKYYITASKVDTLLRDSLRAGCTQDTTNNDESCIKIEAESEPETNLSDTSEFDTCYPSHVMDTSPDEFLQNFTDHVTFIDSPESNNI